MQISVVIVLIILTSFLTLGLCITRKSNHQRHRRSKEGYFSGLWTMAKQMAEARIFQSKIKKPETVPDLVEETSPVPNSILGFLENAAVESALARASPKLNPKTEKKQSFQSKSVHESLSEALGALAVDAAAARAPEIPISNDTYKYAQEFMNKTLVFVPMLKPVEMVVSNGTDTVINIAGYLAKLPNYIMIIVKTVITVMTVYGGLKLIWIAWITYHVRRKNKFYRNRKTIDEHSGKRSQLLGKSSQTANS